MGPERKASNHVSRDDVSASRFATAESADLSQLASPLTTGNFSLDDLRKNIAKGAMAIAQGTRFGGKVMVAGVGAIAMSPVDSFLRGFLQMSPETGKSEKTDKSNKKADETTDKKPEDPITEGASPKRVQVSEHNQQATKTGTRRRREDEVFSVSDDVTSE